MQWQQALLLEPHLLSTKRQEVATGLNVWIRHPIEKLSLQPDNVPFTINCKNLPVKHSGINALYYHHIKALTFFPISPIV